MINNFSASENSPAVSGITRIKIEGFRRLRNVETQMSKFMVLIGANGSGKTSFLDALEILSASASGKLSDTLSDAGGISSLLTRGKSNTLSLSIDMDVPGHKPLCYCLRLVPQGMGYAIAEEQLSQQRDDDLYERPFMHIYARFGNVKYFDPDTGRLEHPYWDYNPAETALSQVPKMFRQSESFRKVLASATKYHSLDVSKNAPVKMPQVLRPSSLPGANGEELLSLLFSLKEGTPERFETITNSLRAAFPGFDELNFPPVAAGMLAMTWKDKNFPQTIYANELSEGILRFLWLTALLQSPGLSAITMIDEPEVSLHPELLDLLSQLMRESSADTQIIAATHSDRFVRFLQPEEVYIADIDEEGETTITRADSLNLEEWMRDYSLDELWQMGTLGGRS